MASTADAAFLAVTLAALVRKKREKRKRRWSKEWYKMRDRFTHEQLLAILREKEPEDYKNFLRMDQESFDILLNLVRPWIEKKDTHLRAAIPASQRLSITLRYLASGMDLEDLKFMCAIAPQTLEGIIMETCSAISEALKHNIKLPKSELEWKQVAQEYEEQWQFHNCIGSVDGKHVLIQKPANSGSYYYNYKGSFSIVLMAIVNADYQFMMVDVGANGRVSDGGVLKNTLFWRKFSTNQLNIPAYGNLPGFDKNLPYVFVGDEAFQLLPNFMKPYNRAVLTNEKAIFNYRLSRARRVVENVFGIVTQRFKIFQREIKFAPSKARQIVLACCHLHNYLCDKNKARYLREHDIDTEDTSVGNIKHGSWRQDTKLMQQLQRCRGNSTLEAKAVRDEFCKFFNTSGSVSWQDKCIFSQ